MLSQIWCLASCGQFVHLYHMFCMNNNAMFHFYCSLYLLISGALIEFNLFDPSRSSVVRFTGFAAFGKQCMNTEWAKWWYRTILKINRCRYFPSNRYTVHPYYPDNQVRVFMLFFSPKRNQMTDRNTLPLIYQFSNHSLIQSPRCGFHSQFSYYLPTTTDQIESCQFNTQLKWC